MPRFFVKQPYGKFALFSTIVDDFTEFGLSDEEAVEVASESLGVSPDIMDDVIGKLDVTSRSDLPPTGARGSTGGGRLSSRLRSSMASRQSGRDCGKWALQRMQSPRKRSVQQRKGGSPDAISEPEGHGRRRANMLPKRFLGFIHGVEAALDWLSPAVFVDLGDDKAG